MSSTSAFKNSGPNPYLLVVRWPIGGIRTHIKYGRDFGGTGANALRPHLVAFEGPDADQLLENLKTLPSEDHTKGVKTLVAMALRVFTTCLKIKAKVVHSHGFISALTAAPATWLLRKRHVVTIHDTLEDAKDKGTSKIVFYVLGLVLRNAFAVHAVGYDCAQVLRKLPFMKNARNIVVIENGVNIALFQNVHAVNLREKLSLKPDTKIAGFFGRFMPQKGFPILVDAIEIMHRQNSVPVKIVAVGDRGFMREYQQDIEERGLSEHFIFMPRVENAASWIAGCDMIVMPSLSEAYSILAAEVACLGVPLIATDGVGLREVVAGTAARIVPHGSAQALVEALKAEVAQPSTKAALEYTMKAWERYDVGPKASAINYLLTQAQTRKFPWFVPARVATNGVRLV